MTLYRYGILIVCIQLLVPAVAQATCVLPDHSTYQHLIKYKVNPAEPKRPYVLEVRVFNRDFAPVLRSKRRLGRFALSGNQRYLAFTVQFAQFTHLNVMDVMTGKTRKLKSFVEPLAELVFSRDSACVMYRDQTGGLKRITL